MGDHFIQKQGQHFEQCIRIIGRKNNNTHSVNVTSNKTLFVNNKLIQFIV